MVCLTRSRCVAGVGGLRREKTAFSLVHGLNGPQLGTPRALRRHHRPPPPVPGAGLCVPSQPPPLKSACGSGHGPGTNAPLCYRKCLSTWLQRRTSSDSWAWSTSPQSREMPDPIRWPPLPLFGNGGAFEPDPMGVFGPRMFPGRRCTAASSSPTWEPRLCGPPLLPPHRVQDEMK